MFARIALLSAPYSTLTYALPDIFPEEFWQEGLRVAIPLGRGALRAGILMERLEHSDLPDGVTCKEVAWQPPHQYLPHEVLGQGDFYRSYMLQSLPRNDG